MSEIKQTDDSLAELGQAYRDLGEYFLNHVMICGGYPSEVYRWKRIPGYAFVVHNEDDRPASLEWIEDARFLAHWRGLKEAVEEGEYEDMIEAFGEEGWCEGESSD